MKLKNYEYKVGELVKVLVNEKHRCLGKIIELKDNVTTIEIKTYYKDDMIVVQRNVNELLKTVKDIGNFKKYGNF